MQKQLGQSDARNFVDLEFYVVRDQCRLDGRGVAAIERDMVHRTRTWSSSRYANACAGRIDAIAFPFGDVDAGYFAEIQPVSGEPQRRTGTDAHPEGICVEIASSV